MNALLELVRQHEENFEITNVYCGSWTTSVLTKAGNVYTCGEASSATTECRKMNISCVKELFSGERIIFCRDIFNDFYVLTDDQAPLKIMFDKTSIVLNRLFCNVDEEGFIGYEIFDKSSGKWYVDMKQGILSDIDERTLQVEKREQSFLLTPDLEITNGEPMPLIKDVVYCFQTIIILFKDNTIRAFETDRGKEKLDVTEWNKKHKNSDVNFRLSASHQHMMIYVQASHPTKNLTQFFTALKLSINMKTILHDTSFSFSN